MRRVVRAVVALLVVAGSAKAVLAADESRELLERGIKAHGGEALLAKYPAMTAQMKGTYYGQGAAIDFSGEVATQGADQRKAVIDTEAGGMKLRIVHLVNRDKAWVKYNDAAMELEDDDLADAKEEAYSEWVATLTPIKGPAFTLSIVGEVRIDNRPALGITASSKDHRDVNLFFDKESGLLVKIEKRVKDETSRQEVTEETFLSEFKAIQETKQATKFIVKRDGKLYIDGELTDIQPLEKLDESVFAKP